MTTAIEGTPTNAACRLCGAPPPFLGACFQLSTGETVEHSPGPATIYGLICPHCGEAEGADNVCADYGLHHMPNRPCWDCLEVLRAEQASKGASDAD